MFWKLFIFTAAVISAATGCSTIQSVQDTVAGNQNVKVEDKARETLGLKKTGVAECDEVIDILDQKRKGNAGGGSSGEESWLERTKNEVIKQQIYDYVNNNSKSPKEKEDLANNCRAALGYLREEPKKKDEPKK